MSIDSHPKMIIGVCDVSFDENVAFLWLTAGILHQELWLFGKRSVTVFSNQKSVEFVAKSKSNGNMDQEDEDHIFHTFLGS